MSWQPNLQRLDYNMYLFLLKKEKAFFFLFGIKGIYTKRWRTVGSGNEPRWSIYWRFPKDHKGEWRHVRRRWRAVKWRVSSKELNRPTVRPQGTPNRAGGKGNTRGSKWHGVVISRGVKWDPFLHGRHVISASTYYFADTDPPPYTQYLFFLFPCGNLQFAFF